MPKYSEDFLQRIRFPSKKAKPADSEPSSKQEEVTVGQSAVGMDDVSFYGAVPSRRPVRKPVHYSPEPPKSQKRARGSSKAQATNHSIKKPSKKRRTLGKANQSWISDDSDSEEADDDDYDEDESRGSTPKKPRRALKQENARQEVREPKRREPEPEPGSIEYLRRESEKEKMKMLQALGLDTVVAELEKPKPVKKLPPKPKPQVPLEPTRRSRRIENQPPMDYRKVKIEEEAAKEEPKPRNKGAEAARREREKRALLRQMRYEL